MHLNKVGTGILSLMAHSVPVQNSAEGSWPVEDLKEILRGLGTSLIQRLDDHDVLLQLNERSRLMFDKVDGLVENVQAKQADHESRIRRLERMVAIGLGALAALDIVLRFIHFGPAGPTGP